MVDAKLVDKKMMPFGFIFEDENFQDIDIFDDFKSQVTEIIQDALTGLTSVGPAQQESPKSDASVFYVSPDNLPHGSSWRALGIYVPYEHAIYIADNLPPHVEKFVYWHEVAHSLGIMDEQEADRFAAEKCSYYLDLRRVPGFIARY